MLHSNECNYEFVFFFFLFSVRLCEKISVCCNATFSSCIKKTVHITLHQNDIQNFLTLNIIIICITQPLHVLYVFNVLFYLISMVLIIFFDSVAFDYEKYFEKITLFNKQYLFNTKKTKIISKDVIIFFQRRLAQFFELADCLMLR